MKKPKVSVVIPAYNHERFVGEAIQSVLDQTFQDFELIIINDGSTDNSEREILKFKDEHIRYYSQENRGLSRTLNRAIELAQGDYFNFLPSDDAFFPEKLEIQLRCFEESSDLGLVFAYPFLIDAGGNEIKDDPAARWAIVPYETKEEIFPALFERDFLSAPTALIRMECFRRVGVFDEFLKTTQDYDMWMRILKYCDLKLIKRPLVKYRWHGSNLTYQPTPETEVERAKVLLKAYKDLSIEDLFPSLRQKRQGIDYAQAYEKLAGYMEKSGIHALIPLSQICRDKGKALVAGGEGFSELSAREGGGALRPKLLREEGKKINILIETPTLDKGGMEEVIYNLATHLDPTLFRPVVVCTHNGGYTAERIKRRGIPVEVLSNEKEKEYVEILRRYEIDLVNVHFSFFGPVIAHRYGIPAVAVLHNIYGWYSGGILDEFRVADQYISKYIAVSNQVASFFRHRFNIESSRIKIIPAGIDLERFAEKTQKLGPSDLGFNEGDFIFLHVGAITPAKMHNLLIAAMKEISKIDPKVKLISVGPALDKDYYSFIQKMIDESHLEDSIKLIGFVENPSQYYQAANAFLLPSLIEGWGIVTLEAMYHGLPLILTKVGGAEELIEDQDLGILVENCCDDIFQLSGPDLDYYSHLDSPRNKADLIGAMLHFSANREEWRKRGREGRSKVVSRYTWDQIVPRYESEFIRLALEWERQRRSQLKEIVREQERRLDQQSAQIDDLLVRLHGQAQTLRGLEKKLDDQTGVMGEKFAEVEQRFNSVHERLDYIVVRLSLTERVKGIFFRLLKAVHKAVPKKIREKYRASYRNVFWDKLSSEKERYERPLHPIDHSKVPIAKELEQFLTSLEKNESEKLFVIYAADPFIESQGQRSTWLTKELIRRNIPVVLFYWRWDPHEEVVRSGLRKIFSIPIDRFSEVEDQLFTFSQDALKKVFLIEFPDSFLFEKINMANVNSFVTVYDCIDNWEEFAKAGQAVWYDPAVERYLVQHVNLVTATNSGLAEKVRQMGAEKVPVIPNGVELESLAQKEGMKKVLEKGTLTIGYFGHLTDSWFDWDLVLATASERKDWFFHIIGYGEPSGLKFPKNVRFWGKVEHEELPSYARSWDVAIIPFKQGKLTQAVDPIKLYEYLSLGLPVVAANMPHLKGIPGVFPCTKEDFEENLLRAKEASFDGEEVKRFVGNCTWKKRVDQLLEEIDRIDLSRDALKGIE